MIRILVVDDSMFMRGAIAKTLTATGTFEVVGQARDGEEALKRVLELRPDVVSMDFNMPGWTGIDAIHAIMRQRPTPIVMFSAHTQKGAKETLDALAAGAVDFVTKPAGEVSSDLSKVQEELVRKLTAAAGSRPRGPVGAALKVAPRSGSVPATATPVPGSSPRGSLSATATPVPASSPRGSLSATATLMPGTSLRGSPSGSVPPSANAPPSASVPPSASAPLSARPPVPAPRPSAPGGALPKLCVIAVSTGGPVALTQLVPALPADTRFAIVIVQHMPAHFTAALAERLDAISPLTVREAKTGDRPRPGLILIAAGDQHLEFDDRGTVLLHSGPLVHSCRPAADLTMISAARVFGRRTIGVVLTGMGKDGTAGALAIRKVEGRTLAQDEESSVIFGMPRAAIEAGAIEEVAPLGEIAGRLRYL